MEDSVRLGFEHELWKALDLLRGRMSIPAQRRLVLGLVFLAGLPPVVGGHALPAAARWGALRSAPAADLAGRLDAAMSALKRALPDVLGSVPSTLGGEAVGPERLLSLVGAIDALRTSLSRGRARDLLGRCYEFFLERFAEGASRGEFYTPPSVARLLVRLVEPVGDAVYDPCCGSGGLLARAAAHRSGDQAPRLVGQECNPETRAIAAMSLFSQGLAADLGPAAADTLALDQHAGLRVQTIVANPPFNLRRWRTETAPDDPRWGFGLPPVSNANYAWIQHILAHLAPGGRGAVVLANGAMSTRLRAERRVRTALLDAGAIEAVVSLPDQLFYATPIPAAIWVVRPPGPPDRPVLFLHAQDLGEMDGRAHQKLPASVIERLGAWMDAARAGAFVPVPGRAGLATRAQLRDREDELTPGIWVGSPRRGPDAAQAAGELEALRAAWARSSAAVARATAAVDAALAQMDARATAGPDAADSPQRGNEGTGPGERTP